MALAQKHAEERLLDQLLPPKPNYEKPAEGEESDGSRDRLRAMLRAGEMDDRDIEIDSQESRMPTMQVFSNTGMEEMGIQLQRLAAKKIL